MKFSNTIKTVLKIYKKYVKNSVWFGTGRNCRCVRRHEKTPCTRRVGSEYEPNKLSTCRDNNDLEKNKFIKSIAKSTQILEGRIQVRMPWNGEGPPVESNYDIYIHAYIHTLYFNSNRQSSSIELIFPSKIKVKLI